MCRNTKNKRETQHQVTICGNAALAEPKHARRHQYTHEHTHTYARTQARAHKHAPACSAPESPSCICRRCQSARPPQLPPTAALSCRARQSPSGRRRPVHMFDGNCAKRKKEDGDRNMQERLRARKTHVVGGWLRELDTVRYDTVVNAAIAGSLTTKPNRYTTQNSNSTATHRAMKSDVTASYA